MKRRIKALAILSLVILLMPVANYAIEIFTVYEIEGIAASIHYVLSEDKTHYKTYIRFGNETTYHIFDSEIKNIKAGEYLKIRYTYDKEILGIEKKSEQKNS